LILALFSSDISLPLWFYSVGRLSHPGSRRRHLPPIRRVELPSTAQFTLHPPSNQMGPKRHQVYLRSRRRIRCPGWCNKTRKARLKMRLLSLPGWGSSIPRLSLSRRLFGRLESPCLYEKVSGLNFCVDMDLPSLSLSTSGRLTFRALSLYKITCSLYGQSLLTNLNPPGFVSTSRDSDCCQSMRHGRHSLAIAPPL
jgi:hypothetical protein